MTRRLALAAAAALLALSGCASKTPSASPTLDTVLSPTPTATSTAAATATGAPSTPPKSSLATTAPPTGPRIVYFREKAKASCAGHGPGGTFGGGVVLEWSAVNVDQVTISIDGPGIFGTYDPTFSHEFAFPCGSTPGTYKHKFTLRTKGGGAVKEQTLELEAKVF